MTELMHRPDHTFPPSEQKESFAVHDTIGEAVPPIPEYTVRGTDGPDMQQVAAEAREDALAHAQGDRYIYTHQDGRRHLEFEIKHAVPQPETGAANRETHFADDAYAESVRRREEAAAREAEHVATNEKLKQGIQWHGEAVVGTRNFAEVYGIDADFGPMDTEPEMGRNRSQYELIG
jgi:hypothetical protein